MLILYDKIKLRYPEYACVYYLSYYINEDWQKHAMNLNGMKVVCRHLLECWSWLDNKNKTVDVFISASKFFYCILSIRRKYKQFYNYVTTCNI